MYSLLLTLFLSVTIKICNLTICENFGGPRLFVLSMFEHAVQESKNILII